MTTFVEQTAAKIKSRLSELEGEIARLSKAHAALSPDESKQNGNGNPGLTARQAQALALIEAKPGITTAELSQGMGGTYGYKVVRRLQAAGQIEPCENGWKQKIKS